MKDKNEFYKAWYSLLTKFIISDSFSITYVIITQSKLR
jgi:hypothetical protein